MNQLALHLPMARESDPSTSHAAAKAAKRFQASHAGRILEALRVHPMTAKEISVHTGLSVEQTCRRAIELQRAGKITVLTFGGQTLEREGFRVWAAI